MLSSHPFPKAATTLPLYDSTLPSIVQEIIIRNYSERVDFVNARELPFGPVTSTSDLGFGVTMRLDRSPSQNLAEGPSVRKQFPLTTNISHTFSCWCVAICLDRSGQPGICQGRLKSICPYRSQNQNRYRYMYLL